MHSVRTLLSFRLLYETSIIFFYSHVTDIRKTKFLTVKKVNVPILNGHFELFVTNINYSGNIYFQLR